MDIDEFQESEVMFSDYSSSDQSVESDDEDHERVDERHKHNMRLDGCNKMTTLKRRKSLKKMRRSISSSLPIHIPNNSFRHDGDDDVASPEQFDEDRMVRLPPHLIVERRRANNKEVARSLPLNERNLYYVRNCILRMNDGLFE